MNQNRYECKHTRYKVGAKFQSTCLKYPLFFLIKKKFSKAGSVRGKENKVRDQSSVCLCTPQMATHSGLDQVEVRSRKLCLYHVYGRQPLKCFIIVCCLPAALAKSWIRCRVAGTQPVLQCLMWAFQAEA